MWTRLDDALIDHRKVFIAGDLIGKNGPVIAIGFFAIGLLWANKHLSDGFLPAEVVKRFAHAEAPLDIARALVKAKLWTTESGGYRIHDFQHYNPSASAVKKKREADRARKEAART